MKKPPACVQCRKRKIGCDRVKPICSNCQKNGKSDCFYPDVPGQYVVSNSASQNVNGSRDSNVIDVPHNPELASMEQIREYNTRLQLLNAQHQHHRNSPGPAEPAQFIPRTVQTFENKPVSSANGSAMNLNWVQGPAIFDIMTSPYTQEEVLWKEMDFLKSRLLELQEITGKKVGVDLKIDSRRHGSNTGGSRGTDGFEDDEDYDDAYQSAPIKRLKPMDGLRSINEFRDLDPQFLDAKTIFGVFHDKDNDLLSVLHPLTDTPNSVFNVPFLVVRDEYIAQFYARFNSVIKTNFNDLVSQWRHEKNIGMPSHGKGDSQLRFPSRPLTQEIITKYMSTVTDSSSLVPILKPRDLLQTVELLFGRESIFAPSKLELPQLVSLGQVAVCLLLTYETLASSVLIPLRDEQLAMFNQLKDWTPTLRANLHFVRSELDRRNDSLRSVDVLRFIALWKYYETVTDVCDNDTFDGDEDVHLARQLSINHESQNQLLILLWNFIYKNYCWRHLFKGEIPAMAAGSELNSLTVIDPLLNNDISLLNFQIDMVKYLHTKDSVMSLVKVLGLKELFKVRLHEQNKKCYTTAAIINGVVDSLIYHNSMLFINYYLLVQYEASKETEKFIECYKEFLQLVQETLFYVFSNLANLKFAGYEFMFANKSFTTLNNICHMVLGLYERCHQSTQNLMSLDDNLKTEIGQQGETLALLLRKILRLLQDYSKNRKVASTQINKLVCKIRTILEYTAFCMRPQQTTLDQNYTESISPPKGINAFENIDSSSMLKIVTKLRGISESLIKSDFYGQRKPFETVHPDTLGITRENFQSVFNSFYS